MQGSSPGYGGRYAAFGRAAGAQTLPAPDAIAAQPTDSACLPPTRQVISGIRVENFEAGYGDPEPLERE